MPLRLLAAGLALLVLNSAYLAAGDAPTVSNVAAHVILGAAFLVALVA